MGSIFALTYSLTICALPVLIIGIAAQIEKRQAGQFFQLAVYTAVSVLITWGITLIYGFN